MITETSSKGQKISPRTSDLILAVVCVIVIGVFAWSPQPSFHEFLSPGAENSYYNLLVRGFQAGQLNLKMDAPPEMARLSDPYDPALNAPYLSTIFDKVYYHGKIYLYFGPAPAVTLLWPFAALTGHYLSDRDAIVFFFSVGFLTAAGLLRAVWRRYFPQTSVWVAAAVILAFGAAVGALDIIAQWYDVYEVAVTTGFAFTLLALAALWGALHEPKRAVLWLLLASLAYGLAIASRATLIFGAIILLAPAAREALATKSPGKTLSLLAAAILPITLVGFGLMTYNFLRFGNPFEFGLHYQMQNAYNPRTTHAFGLHFFWFNMKYYFWEPMRWASHFPFLQGFQLSGGPSGYFGTGTYYGGILWISLVAWAVLAVSSLWKDRANHPLRWFAGMVVLLFVICAVTTGLFCTASGRYELDFIPALMLVAVIGAFQLEQAGASPLGHRVARYGCLALLAATVLFNALAGLEAHAEANYYVGNFLVRQGQAPQAIPYLEKALAIEPESADFHAGLGTAYYQEKQTDAAVSQYQMAFQIQPDFQEALAAHNNLAYGLLKQGRINDAIDQFQQVLKINPDQAEAHNALGDCYFQSGRMNEALAEYGKAASLQPDFALAQNNFGFTLFQTGHAREAIAHFQKALEIAPNDADVCNNLGCCFLQTGALDSAIVQFQKAIEIQPRFAQAYHNLGDAFQRKGMTNQATASYQKAAQLDAGSTAPK
jgi:tetratricopeptide (TPR) repeat protein